MRLIDADAFNCFDYSAFDGTLSEDAVQGMDVVLNQIDKAPTIDAEPVRHGEWSDGADIIDVMFHRHHFRCKVCHKFADSFIGGTENWWCSEKPNYCPNCGAKMDEVSE